MKPPALRALQGGFAKMGHVALTEVAGIYGLDKALGVFLGGTGMFCSGLILAAIFPCWMGFLCLAGLYCGAGLLLHSCILRRLLLWHPFYCGKPHKAFIASCYFLAWPVAYCRALCRLGLSGFVF